MVHNARRFFTLRDDDRRDFRDKTTGFHGGSRFLLGTQSKGVLLLATDNEFIRQIFRGNSHVIIVERIPQAVMYHAVLHTGMAQPQTGSRTVEKIGRIAHALLTTGYYDLRIAAANRLDRLMHRLQARTAHQING